MVSLLCCIWVILLAGICISACSTPNAQYGGDKTPGYDFVQTMLGFYHADNKLTRIEAMMKSVNLAPHKELINALRERAAHAQDEFERVAACY